MTAETREATLGLIGAVGTLDLTLRVCKDSEQRSFICDLKRLRMTALASVCGTGPGKTGESDNIV